MEASARRETAPGEHGMITSLALLVLAAGAADQAAEAPRAECPVIAGVWAQPDDGRVLVMEQDGCDLTATVQEPKAVLVVKGFWTGEAWTIAATRTGLDGCGTTAWGSLLRAEENRLLINVRGSDGLCSPTGKPARFDATMTYLRKTPAPPG